LHLVFLHSQKSSNPLGLQNSPDKIPFHPYFTFKDITRAIIVFIFFIILCFIYPFILIDPDNFLPANPIVTPVHIQPEWYFLFAYAILRAIPNKLGGVIGLLVSILILFFLLTKPNLIQYNKLNQQTILFWFFVIFFIFLTWLGIKPVEEPFLIISKLFTFFYFFWFLI
jgi:ubiquinol-cytochrome c reductase cytochrome b subunit